MGSSLISRTHAGSQLTLRELAKRAGTSHATLSAYAHGRVDPSTETLARVVRAGGFGLTVLLQRRIRDHQGLPRGQELAMVLELAGVFPHRDVGPLGPARFGK